MLQQNSDGAPVISLLLRNADLYVPEHLGIRDLLIVAGKIAAVGEKLPVSLPDLQVLDLEGATVLPGLFDQHVHVTGGGGEKGFSSRVRDLTAQQLYEAGVTSVVGLLGTDSLTRSVASLLAKVRALQEEGLSAWCLTGAYTIDSPTLTGSVAEDVCFLPEVLGVKLAISDHRCSQVTWQELARLAARVRFGGLTGGKAGVVHLHVGTGKAGLQPVFDVLDRTDLPIAQFRPTHCESVVDDALRFGKLGGIIDFTADDDPELSAPLLVRAAEELPWEQITLSSDAGGSIPIWNEKKEMIGMGVGTPSTLLPVVRTLRDRYGWELGRALACVTSHPADALKLPTGRILPGRDADLIIVDRDLVPQKVYTKGALRWRRDTDGKAQS